MLAKYKIDKQCIVCAGNIFINAVYGGYFYEGKAYDLIKCVACGFIFLNPMPGREILNSIYNGKTYFDNYYATSSGITSYVAGSPQRQSANMMLLEIIKKFKKSGSLFEIGCAGGAFLWDAKKEGFEVSGIEPNEWMAGYARKNLQLNVVKATLEEVNPRGNFFDIIYVGDVLEHMLNLNWSIVAIKRLMADNGIFVISQPLDYNKSIFSTFLKVNMMFKRNKYSANPPLHLWEFNPTTLKRFMINSGLNVLYYKIYESQAKPLSVCGKVAIKKKLGWHIKDISCRISNLPLLNKFKLGDRCIAVCSKK